MMGIRALYVIFDQLPPNMLTKRLAKNWRSRLFRQ